MKRIFAIALLLGLLFSGCTAAPEPTATTQTTAPATTAAPTTEPTGPKDREDTRLAILLPEDANWAAAGEDLQMLLQNLHYQVELMYADSDAWEQAQQLSQVLEWADGIIIAPVESAALTEVCLQVKEKELPLFSYDRLLMDTEAVSYYVSYDYRKIGATLAQQIVREACLDTMTEGSLTVELFMGSPEDSSALQLYVGVMDVLQPYFDAGTLVSPSGRVAFEDTCVQDWQSDAVTEAFTGYLQEYYKRGAAPDIICTVSDSFAAACMEVLSQRNVKNQPLITGLGGTEAARAAVAEGKQLITVSTDLYLLNEHLVETVDAVMTGKEPQINDRESCHNNALTVPAYLCEFETVIAEVAATEPPTEPE